MNDADLENIEAWLSAIESMIALPREELTMTADAARLMQFIVEQDAPEGALAEFLANRFLSATIA